MKQMLGDGKGACLPNARSTLAVKGSPGHVEGKKSDLHEVLSFVWWQREFALLRAALASAGFGILKQPRQTCSLVTNRTE